MRKTTTATLLLLLALGASGCSYVDKLTGDTDDKVLPGTRENAIPGKAQFPEANEPVTITQPGGAETTVSGGETATGSTSSTSAPDAGCAPDDADCAPSTDNVFSDPQ